MYSKEMLEQVLEYLQKLSDDPKVDELCDRIVGILGRDSYFIVDASRKYRTMRFLVRAKNAEEAILKLQLQPYYKITVEPFSIENLEKALGGKEDLTIYDDKRW